MKSKIFLTVLILVNIIVLSLVVYLVWPRPEPTVDQQEAMMHQGPLGPMAGMGRQGMMANQAVPVSHEWTVEETETLRSLWIGSLPPLPPDPSNQYGMTHRRLLSVISCSSTPD